MAPDNAREQYGLGTTCLNANLLDEAIAPLEGAIRLGPKYAAAHCNLSPMLIDKGGFLITTTGEVENLDTVTLSALAAASFAATQGLANHVDGPSNFGVKRELRL